MKNMDEVYSDQLKNSPSELQLQLNLKHRSIYFDCFNCLNYFLLQLGFELLFAIEQIN
jgi:hypothetical protein